MPHFKRFFDCPGKVSLLSSSWPAFAHTAFVFVKSRPINSGGRANRFLIYDESFPIPHKYAKFYRKPCPSLKSCSRSEISFFKYDNFCAKSSFRFLFSGGANTHNRQTLSTRLYFCLYRHIAVDKIATCPYATLHAQFLL